MNFRGKILRAIFSHIGDIMYISLFLFLIFAMFFYGIVRILTPVDTTDLRQKENERIANSRMEHFNARLDKEQQEKVRWY
jgi:hypothetical protein